MNLDIGTGKSARVNRNLELSNLELSEVNFGYFMKEKNQDRQKNSSYPELRVKWVWVNEFQL